MEIISLFGNASLTFQSKNRSAFVIVCLCLIFFVVFTRSGNAQTIDSSLHPKIELPPLTIDDKYLRNDIQTTNDKGVITLTGAVSEAEFHNKQVKEARLAVSRFKYDYVGSELNRLPNIRVMSYLAQQTVSSPLIPARADAFYFLSALFPITQQYRFGLQARAAKLAQEIAAQNLRKELNETTSKVKTAYYKLVLDQSLLADVEDSIKYLGELEKVVQDRVRHGNSLRVEALQVSAKFSKAQLEKIKASDAYKIDCERFNHLLGRNLNANVTLEAIPPPEKFELNIGEAEQEALAARPEVREAVLRVKQLDLEKRIIMSEYIPNVSAGVIYTGLPGFNNSLLPKNVLAPGIFINWNAFDWGRKAMFAKGRKRVEEAAKLSSDDVKEEVLIDLHSQMNKLTESRLAVQTTQFTRAAAHEEMRISLNRFKYTSAQLSDVLQAQSSLADANNNYHQALLALWQAKAEFERAVGLDN